MHQRHDLKRSLSSLQSAYQARQKREPKAQPFPSPWLTPAFKACQFIASEPTKAELRRHGSEKFKCLRTTVPGKPYCEEHYARCIVIVPAKDDSEEISNG